MAPRKGQRDFIPTAIAERNLDIIRVTDTVESSATIAAGANITFTLTTSSKEGVPIWVQEDISLFETSETAANLIPAGSNIDASGYQIIGPIRDQASGDGKNIVSKIYIRNAGVATTDFSKRVAASVDDGYKIGGSWGYTGTTIVLGAAAAEPYIPAIRFTNVTIPQGSTINTATLKLNPTFNDVDNILTKIYGIDEDNTADFSSDPTGRTKTTANVDWDFGNVTQDVVETSPDISTVVKEIVDRGSWSSGNAMGFLILDDGSTSNNNISFDTYDGDSARAALLDINYGSGESKTILFRGRTRYITPRDDVTIV